MRVRAGISVITVISCLYCGALRAAEDLHTQVQHSLDLAAKGDMAAAITLMEEARDRARDMPNLNPDSQSSILANLAGLYVAAGNSRKASSAFDEYVEERRKIHGPNSGELAEAYMVVARALLVLDPKLAETAAEQASDIYEFRAKDDPSQTDERLIEALDLQATAAAYRQEGRKADRLFNDAVKRSEALFGSESLPTARARFARALYLKAKWKYRDAIEDVKHALAIFEKAYPGVLKDVLNAHAELIELYGETDQGDLAMAEAQILTKLAPDQIVDAQLIYRAPLDYPKKALRSGKMGQITMGYTVTADGKITDMKVVRGHNIPYFEDSAKSVISKFRYAPGLLDGVPVDCHMEYSLTYTFRD